MRGCADASGGLTINEGKAAEGSCRRRDGSSPGDDGGGKPLIQRLTAMGMPSGALMDLQEDHFGL